MGGGNNLGLSVEKGQDFAFVGDGTSSHVADETSVALSGFRVGQDSKSSILFIFSRSLSTATSNSSSKNETLEEGNTSKESKGGNTGSAKGHSSTRNSSGSNDDGGISDRQGSDGQSSSKCRFHDDDLRVWFWCVFLRKTEN